MRKFSFYLYLLLALTIVGCSDEFDDSEILASIESLENEIDDLEALIAAYEAKVYVSSVKTTDNGYTINFDNGESITISNGSDASIIYTDNGDSVTFFFDENYYTFLKTDAKIAFETYSNVALSIFNNTIKLILPATLKESDYIALSATVISEGGATSSEVVTRAGNYGDWNIEFTMPTFTTDGIYNDDAAVSIYPTSSIDETSGILTVTYTSATGVNFSTSLTFTYTSNFELLSMYDANSYPTDSNTWVIFNTSVSASEFSGLTDALVSISTNNPGRKISLTFPNLESFPDYAILGQSNTVDIPNFSSLVSVFAPVVTSVGSYAFYKCSALTSIEMPLVTSLGSYAFCHCSSLTSIEMPLVTSLGSYALYCCDSLTSIEMPLVTEIGNTAIGCCYSLTSIELPLVTEIGNTAFWECSSLTSIEMPLVTEIGNYTFLDCSSLTSIEAPLVTKIGYLAFSNCFSVTSIKMPLVTEIGSTAFNCCYSLTSIEIPLVTSLELSTFNYCYSLTSIEMPSVTEIGTRAFYGCSSLSSLSVATNDGVVLESVGDYSFGNTSLVAAIDLTIGSANASKISGNTLTVSGYSNTFKSITLK